MQNLVYNDDGLVEKISCSRLFSDSTQGKETVELTEEEKKRFCWLVLMLDTEPIDRVEGDSRPPIRIKKNNPVLKDLQKITDWSQRKDTQLELYHEKGKRANYELLQAEYVYKSDAYSHINGTIYIKDYNLNSYHDQPGKFSREAHDGSKIKQALFFLPLILPDKNLVGQSVKMLGADDLIEAGLVIYKEQVCPAVPSRPLVFRKTSNALELKDKKVTCKVRVRALDNGEEKPDIKSHEKTRVLWVSVMIKAGEEKKPERSAWNTAKKILEDANYWGELENTELEQPYKENQFNIHLHKTSQWEGNDGTIAQLELSLDKINGVKIYEHPENFWQEEIQNNLHIFPIAVAPHENDVYKSLTDNPWSATKSATNLFDRLGDYVIGVQDAMKDFTVKDIPSVMRDKLNWHKSADVMELWFKGSAFEMKEKGNSKKWPSLSEHQNKTLFPWVWLEKFDRVRNAKKELLDSLNTPNAQMALKGKFQKIIDPEVNSSIWEWNKKDIIKLHLDTQFQFFRVGYEMGVIDDLYGSLGNFALYAAITKAFIVKRKNTKKLFNVRLQELGIYMQDTFDFEGTQYLGHWNKEGMGLNLPGAILNRIHKIHFEWKSPGWNPTMGWARAFNNKDFRKYREETIKNKGEGEGEDLLLFSDVKRLLPADIVAKHHPFDAVIEVDLDANYKKKG